jgi:CRISPR/Cas system Type II protein with McrA/HNH and RuvC-like nuclease domain
MYEFVCKHKIIIEKANYFEWARFLEKVNSENDTTHLLTKIDESTKRTNLSIYRHILYNEFENSTCFYCGKKIAPRSVDVDHFIPWSFS